jgi:hypothetical protein
MDNKTQEIVNVLTSNTAIKKLLVTASFTVVAFSSLQPAIATSKVTMTEQNAPNSTLIADGWNFVDTFNSIKDYYNPANQITPTNTQPDDWGQVGRKIFDYGVGKLEAYPLLRSGSEVLKGLEYGCDLYNCFTPIHAGD